MQKIIEELMETLKQNFICSLTASLNFALLLIWSSKILFRERSLMEEIVWIERQNIVTDIQVILRWSEMFFQREK